MDALTKEYVLPVLNTNSPFKLFPHHLLPGWLNDNKFLFIGHRPPLASIKLCLTSVFRLHTETGNIWTHLLGKIIFYNKLFST